MRPRSSTPISLTLTRPIAGLEHLPLILSLPLKSNSLPYAVHIALVAVGFYAVISMLSISQGFLLPMIYAFIMAILISPVVDKMEHHGVNRALSTLLVMLVVTALIVGLIALLSWQLSLFSDQWPELKERSKQLWDQAIGWSARNLNISKRKMNAWLAATSSDMMQDNRAMIGNTITSLGEAMATIFLTPVYVFMMVLYKAHVLEFIHRLSGKHNDIQIGGMMDETRVVVRSYLVGLSIEFAILAVLNVGGLLLLGIPYAILLGVIGAMLNIIPYVGGLVGVVMFMAIALVTGTPMDMLYVFILYIILQFVDNNFIVPKIVGSKVKLNPLASLISVILGAALWGLPGMFLSIPLLAIVKVVLDRLPELTHWGFLLGDPIAAQKPTDKPTK
jgi:predicted PurR-regulated permease PerM